MARTPTADPAELRISTSEAAVASPRPDTKRDPPGGQCHRSCDQSLEGLPVENGEVRDYERLESKHHGEDDSANEQATVHRILVEPV